MTIAKISMNPVILAGKIHDDVLFKLSSMFAQIQ